MLVVSEESSQIAVAQNGTLERDVDAERLREIISGNAAAGDPVRTPPPVESPAPKDAFARAR